MLRGGLVGQSSRWRGIARVPGQGTPGGAVVRGCPRPFTAGFFVEGRDDGDFQSDSMSPSSFPTDRPKPPAILSRLLSDGLRLPSSMSPMYVLFIPTIRANSRWDKPRSSRRSLIRYPSFAASVAMRSTLCDWVQ